MSNSWIHETFFDFLEMWRLLTRCRYKTSHPPSNYNTRGSSSIELLFKCRLIGWRGRRACLRYDPFLNISCEPIHWKRDVVVIFLHIELKARRTCVDNRAWTFFRPREPSMTRVAMAAHCPADWIFPLYNFLTFNPGARNDVAAKLLIPDQSINVTAGAKPPSLFCAAIYFSVLWKIGTPCTSEVFETSFVD